MAWRLVGPLMVYNSRGISFGDAMFTCRGVQTPFCGQPLCIRQERDSVQTEGSLFWMLPPSNMCTRFLVRAACAICSRAPPQHVGFHVWRPFTACLHSEAVCLEDTVTALLSACGPSSNNFEHPWLLGSHALSPIPLGRVLCIYILARPICLCST